MISVIIGVVGATIIYLLYKKFKNIQKEWIRREVKQAYLERIRLRLSGRGSSGAERGAERVAASAPPEEIV